MKVDISANLKNAVTKSSAQKSSLHWRRKMKLLRKLMVCLFSSQIPFVRVLLIALSSREADILCSKAGGLIRFLRSKTPIYDTISVIMVTT